MALHFASANSGQSFPPLTAVEMLNHSSRTELMRLSTKDWPDNSSLSDMEVSIQWQKVRDDRSGATLKTIPVTNISSPRPTDLLIGTTVIVESPPLINLRLSFKAPRVGSKVICVGYGAGTQISDEDSPTNFTFQAIEATVIAIFPSGLGAFLDAACFVIDVEPPHGMSGGPVFNEAGDVCGVVSAGMTTFMPDIQGFPKEAGAVSLLHPALSSNVKASATQGTMTANIEGRLIDWVREGHIRTDGTEKKCHLIEVSDGTIVGATFDKRIHTPMYGGLQDFLNNHDSAI